MQSTRVTWIVALAVFAGLSWAGIHYGPSPIEGDETEYYATTYAWAMNRSPALTPAVVSAIRAAIPGRPATEPATARAVDGTYYAIHFWFLSLLAAPFFALCSTTGLDWKHCFVFLISGLFAFAVALAFRWFRWGGALLLALGLAVSPLVPYLNKAHGEAYSVSLAAIAALCMARGRWLAAAVALAFIAVQVTAFSPLVLLALAISGAWRRLGSAWRCPTLCAALLALQPLWTLWRFHTLNVIVAEGFVYPEMATPHRIASMLLDPDVGFFFIWPASLALLALARWRGLGAYWLFVAALVAEMSYIGAQQMNYTTSAPRYSLWFVPFLLVGVVAACGTQRTICAGLALTAMGGYLYFVTGVHPKLERKPLAEWWYRYLPGVWDPEEQVFADVTMHEQIESGKDLFRKRRFPITRLPDRRVWALGNRGCTKLLVFGWAFTSSHVEPVKPLGCEGPVDAAGLLGKVRGMGITGIEDRFVPGAAPPQRTVAAQKGWPYEFSDARGWQYVEVATMRVGDRTLVYDQPRHELSVIRENGLISLGEVPGRGRGDALGRGNARGVGVEGGGDAAVRGKARGVVVEGSGDSPVRGHVVEGRGDELGRGDARGVGEGGGDAAVRGKARGVVVEGSGDSPGRGVARGVTVEGRGDVLTVWLPERASYSAAVGLDDPLPITFDAESADGPVVIGYPERTARVWILIHDKLSIENGCYFELQPGSRVVSEDHSRCTVELRPDGRLNITRLGLFDSAKRVWARYQDRDGKVSAWREIGRWPGPGETDSMPAWMQPDGPDSLRVRVRDTTASKVWLLINDTLAIENSCYVLYQPAARSLYLDGAGGRLENDRCRVTQDAAGIRVTRKGDFRGPHFVWVADHISHWLPLGRWY